MLGDALFGVFDACVYVHARVCIVLCLGCEVVIFFGPNSTASRSSLSTRTQCGVYRLSIVVHSCFYYLARRTSAATAAVFYHYLTFHVVQ